MDVPIDYGDFPVRYVSHYQRVLQNHSKSTCCYYQQVLHQLTFGQVRFWHCPVVTDLLWPCLGLQWLNQTSNDVCLIEVEDVEDGDGEM